MNTSVILLIGLVAAFSISSAYGLQCYKCDKCPEPFKSSGSGVSTVTCKANEECWKSSTRTSSGTEFYRDCIEVEAKKTDKNGKAFVYEVIEAYCKDKDFCNHSANVKANFVFLSIFVSLFVFFYRKF